MVLFAPILILGQDQIVPSIEKVPLPDSLKKTGIITKTMTFSKESLRFSKRKLYNAEPKYKNKKWDIVELKGIGSSAGELSKPSLPVNTIKVAIPWATKIVSIEALPQDSFVVPRKYDLIPGEAPERSYLPRPGEQISESFKNFPDSTIYNLSTPYPDTVIKLLNEGDLLGQGLAWFTIYPMIYIPIKGKLILFTKIKLEITYGPRPYIPIEKPLKSYMPEMIKILEEIKNSVINPEDVKIPTQ